jgi:hypothetical protein
MGGHTRFILGALAFAVAALGQDTPLFHFTEKPGPHLVGLKVVEQYDYSRTYRSKIDDLGVSYPRERAPNHSFAPSSIVAV